MQFYHKNPCKCVVLALFSEHLSALYNYNILIYNMDRVGTGWTILLQNSTEGTHFIDIKPAGAESTEIKIKVVGIGANTDIDDMFNL